MLIPESREITGNLTRLGGQRRVWQHQVLLRAIFEGEWRERGAQEGRAYSQRSQLEGPARKLPRRLPSLTLFWICGRAGDGERASVA